MKLKQQVVVCHIYQVEGVENSLCANIYDATMEKYRKVSPKRVLGASAWGDSFQIVKKEGGKWGMTLYKNKDLVSGFEFDYLEDGRKDKSFGGDYKVYEGRWRKEGFLKKEISFFPQSSIVKSE